MLEQLEDGRLNMLTRGTRPLRVLERQGHLPYPAGIVEFLADRRRTSTRRRLAARAVYADLVERATDREPEPRELAELDAYAMAATVDFGAEAKQGLLDLRSENARLRLVTRLSAPRSNGWTSSTAPRPGRVERQGPLQLTAA